MTKPKNFPGRKLERKGASEREVEQAKGIRTKKTPKETWSTARKAHRGKIYR